MYKKEVWSITILVLIINISTTVTAINIQTIEPGNLSSVNITFSTAGNNTTHSFQVQKNATIFYATINVTGFNLSAQYPISPFIDISNDGDIDWNYSGIYNITNITFFHLFKIS